MASFPPVKSQLSSTARAAMFASLIEAHGLFAKYYVKFETQNKEEYLIAYVNRMEARQAGVDDESGEEDESDGDDDGGPSLEGFIAHFPSFWYFVSRSRTAAAATVGSVNILLQPPRPPF